MKIALITTTINVPKVLELYKKFEPENTCMFVAGDKKTPPEARKFCDGLEFVHLDDVERQIELGYECSELIGWNTDSRRNIALLEALKWGADLIFSCDDDMFPLGSEWIRPELFELPYDGIQCGAPAQWADIGSMTVPEASQRGLPPDTSYFGATDFVMGAEIGVAQGIILGVPDTGAVPAMASPRLVHSANDILRNGFVVHPQAYAVFNSQITAFRRELAPAFAQFYAHQGRNTDIFASILMRRIMQQRNLYTYYGPPMGFHARQSRPLFKDLEAEMYGLKHIQAFADYLAGSSINGKNVIDDCDHLMMNCPIFSDEMKTVAAAWYNDCSKVL